MKISSRIFAFAACLLFARVGFAHFIWVDVAPIEGTPRAHLYFGEAPGPGEPHLIGKIAHAKAWTRTATGETKELKLTKSKSEDRPALVADQPSAAPCSVEMFCDYGVYAHGGPGVLLQYYAKHLAGDCLEQPSLAKSDKLKLDIAPSVAAAKLTLAIQYEKKPAADREVSIVDPANKEHVLKTDSAGQVIISDTKAGRYSVRVGYIEPDRSGERDGKAYKQTWHYATLTFELPESSAASASVAKPKADPEAVAALVRARAGRAIWKEFPGYAADVTVTAGDQRIVGRVTIDASGVATLEAPASALTAWTEEQLASLVQHRMPDGEISEGAIRWAEADMSHPLGRLIDLGDPHLKSAYRLKDDVIMEVNRQMGPDLKFTISVLEIVRNTENKYLPRSFVMNFFDTKTGEIKTSLAFLNEWQRVGQFDLPSKIVEVNSAGGVSTTRQLEFTNLKLAGEQKQ